LRRAAFEITLVLMRLSLIAPIVTALALTSCAVAEAATTVTLGPPTLTSGGSAAQCFVTCDVTWMQRSVTDAATRLVAPADGVVTGWRVDGSLGTGSLRLRVLRPGEGSAVTGVATSAAATNAGGATANSTSLAIEAGDRVGIESAGPANQASVYLLAGGSWDTWSPNVADGSSASPVTSGNNGLLQYNADVELAAPVVGGISPQQGAAAGGDSVTISGDHLANASAVTFGGQAATIVSNTNSQIVVKSPAGAPGAVDVQVTAPGGTGVSADRFTYIAPPTPTKASLTAVHATNAVFAVGGQPTPIDGVTGAATHPKGTTFSFGLDQPAQVTVTIQRRGQGRLQGGKCKPRTHKNRKRKHCTLWRTAGTLHRSGHAGHNSIAFSGRIEKKALKPGRYRARITAVTAGGRTAPKTLTFRIVKH
jgi:hypothetical protein